jgi:hypothetical protein
MTVSGMRCLLLLREGPGGVPRPRRDALICGRTLTANRRGSAPPSRTW